MNFAQNLFNVSNNFSSNEYALHSASQSITYSDLENKILETVSHLKTLGISGNEYVGVLSNNSPGFVILIFSLWISGAIPILINNRLLENEIAELLSLSGCKRIFISNELESKYSSSGIQKFIFPFDNLHEKNVIQSNINLDSTALIIFTSGSTGKPKGVEITFNNLVQSALTGNQYFAHQENDRWLASLPFYHVGGFSIIVRTFLFGATLLFPDSLDIKHLANAIKNLHPTHASFVSTQLKRLIESGTEPNEELRQVLLGGGFIELSLIETAMDKGWNVAKSFGATETCSFVSVLTTDQFSKRRESAGKALPPNEILILDENNNIMPPGETGEIVIKGNSVTKGYLNNPDETKKKFSNGFYYTGDYGFLDENGFLFVEARRNDLIITGGENVNPVEVENELLKHPLINEVSVFSLMEQEWGQIIAAALVIKNNSDITLEEIKSYLNNKLASYKHPKKILILKSLPKTDLGKVQKEKLREMFKN
ncbi:MAG: o-succinylbenzoate--CoA ligase [Ignavibacteriaceae bacterium]